MSRRWRWRIPAASIRLLGGGLRPPSEASPQDQVAPAEPALEPRRGRARHAHDRELTGDMQRVENNVKKVALAYSGGLDPIARRGASPPFRSLPPGPGCADGAGARTAPWSGATRP